MKLIKKVGDLCTAEPSGTKEVKIIAGVKMKAERQRETKPREGFEGRNQECVLDLGTEKKASVVI